MTNFLQLALLISVILLSAKLAGYLSVRLGQPSVLGELLVGILLGPSVIDILHLPLQTDDRFWYHHLYHYIQINYEPLQNKSV